MKQSTRLIINVVSNAVTLCLNLVIGFVMAPLLVVHLGDETYGVWAVIGSVLGYSTLLSIGLNSSVDRWIPMQLVHKDYDGIRFGSMCLSYLERLSSKKSRLLTSQFVECASWSSDLDVRERPRSSGYC